LGFRKRGNIPTRTPSITYDEPGSYTVTLIAGISNDECQDTIQQTVTIIPFNPQIIGDTVSCEGDLHSLSIVDGVAYEWSTGDTTLAIDVDPLTTTTYSAIVTHVDGCKDTINHTIVVHPIFALTFSASICKGDSYTENGFNLINVRNVGDNVYTLPLNTIHGCDSIITLYLEVNRFLKWNLEMILPSASKMRVVHTLTQVEIMIPIYGVPDKALV
jgi:PKD repeat protein